MSAGDEFGENEEYNSCDDSSESNYSGITREMLCKEIDRLKNVVRMNEEIHEQKIIEEHEQMKYY